MSVEKASRGFVSRDVEQKVALPGEEIDPARRSFFKGLGAAGLSATAAMLFGDVPILKAQSTAANRDAANDIFTAALVAEDLATTFYYLGLTTAAVIQDPSLAGPGGSATNVTAGGNLPNVTYLRAAMAQEIAHANLLRAVGKIGTDATTDPYQMFYFPTATFQNVTNFIATLETLESAFIGAYITAIREFSVLAMRSVLINAPTGPYGGPYSAAQLAYFGQVAASIMGVECEHRVLGTVITSQNQPNNLNFEQTVGLTAVYHGPKSAVAALTPFLTPSTGQGTSLSMALAAAASLGVPSTGNPPPLYLTL